MERQLPVQAMEERPRIVMDSESPSAFRRWIDYWKLALLAGATWVLTILAFTLDHTLGASASVIVGLYVVAYLTGGTLATRAAIWDLLARTVNVDLLMVLAAIGAATIDAWAEGAVLLALFSTSNALEHHALSRTRNAVRALMDLSPDEANLVTDAGGRVIHVSQLDIGDIVLIRPGEKIPADGEVAFGSTTVDQAAVTGESMPVSKGVGDPLFAGTVNQSGSVHARVTRLSTDSTLAKIVRLVEQAQVQKSKAERFADSFEGPYATGVILISMLVALVPMLAGEDPSTAFYRAMTLLVVASPCALVISTPAATLSAIATAARNGILVKGGTYLELVGAVHTVAFDKTGTITLGKLSVTDLAVFGETTEDVVLARVASAEHLSEHPIGAAIVAEATRRNLPLSDPVGFQSTAGMGVTATVDGELVAIGNEALFASIGMAVPDVVAEAIDTIRRDGRTAMIVGIGSTVNGVIGVADTIRPGVAEVVASLKRLGVARTVMVTGDNRLVAESIAARVGIDEVHADLLPEQKLDLIERFKLQGKVAMIGDGVNDAPALATADLGIAMGGGGTDVALETADLILMGDDLEKLPFAIGLSRKMRRVVRTNLAFSLSVIVVLVLAAMIEGIPLPLGVVGHEGSTIIVVLSSLRLLAYRGSDRDRPVSVPAGVESVPLERPSVAS